MSNPLILIGCGLMAIAGLSCARQPLADQEPRKSVGFREQSRLGFAVSDIADLDRPVSSTLDWLGPAAGFDPLPASGSTPVEVTLSYDGGFVVEVGEPPWEIEAQMVLIVRTADGSVNDTFPGPIRARALDQWVDYGTLSSLEGTFSVVGHPDGNLSYDAFMTRDGGQLTGAVGALVETEQKLSDTAETGTATGFHAGSWAE
jgi:hypothetical protein